MVVPKRAEDIRAVLAREPDLSRPAPSFGLGALLRARMEGAAHEEFRATLGPAFTYDMVYRTLRPVIVAAAEQVGGSGLCLRGGPATGVAAPVTSAAGALCQFGSALFAAWPRVCFACGAVALDSAAQETTSPNKSATLPEVRRSCACVCPPPRSWRTRRQLMGQ